MLIRCEECGEVLPGNEGRCPMCGEALEDAPDITEEIAQPIRFPVNPTREIVFCVLAAFFAVWLIVTFPIPVGLFFVLLGLPTLVVICGTAHGTVSTYGPEDPRSARAIKIRWVIGTVDLFGITIIAVVLLQMN